MRLSHRFLPFALASIIPLAAQDRITGPVDDRVVTRIPATTHRAIRGAQDNGRVAADTALDRMQLVLSSSPEREAALEQLLGDQQDPSSPRYHQWLTPQQFGERFGPSQAELDAVTGWLRSHGFRIDQVANGRRTVEFSGTVGQVEEAFRTEMHRYTVGGEAHIANSTDISVPAALASVVKGIVSLHDFRAKPQHHVLPRSDLKAAAPSYTNSDGSHNLTPYDFATIYDLGPVWNSLSVTGTGQKIAVISRSNISLNDVNTFRSNYGLPPAAVQILINGTDPGILSSTGDDIEASLDTEWSGAIAMGASVILVVSASTATSDGVDLSSAYAVDNNTAPIITYSYGNCEAENGTFNAFYYNLWQQAVAQGTSVFVAAGDNGSAGCDDPSSTSPARHGFGVSGLASTPYNIAVGGTEFNDGGAGPTYWAPTNSTGQVSSALGYIPEVVWNESTYLNSGNPDNGLWAGSGGVSSLYQTPSWQTGPGVPASDPGTTGGHHRYLPDVSLTAAGHDAYLVQAQATTMYIGGTSASTPSFAGIMALINQYTGSANGNPAARFYALAQSTSGVFHDIVSGTNAVPCVSGPFAGDPDCTGPTIAAGVGTLGGYSAGPGYDLASGLGSVDAYRLVTSFGPAATGSGSGGSGSGGSGSGSGPGSGSGSGSGGSGSGGGSTGAGTPTPPAGTTSLSGAHLATGGGWQTLIELINPTATPATAHLRIYDNNGNALAIPLVSVDGTINTTASGLDPQLAPLSVLILQSVAPASGPVLQGSAEVTSNSAISGFLIFTWNPGGQDVLVPLSSGAASSYELAFDNTGGFNTGVALASSSLQTAAVGITALDQNGLLLANTTVTIPPLGHTSFVAATEIAALANQRGTLIFSPPSGAQISLIGIRADPSGAFTAIPVLASSSTGGGLLPDLASGGGWTTLVELVNTSSSPANARLNFFGDDGSPLALPVVSADLGLNGSASTVNGVLPANGTAIIESAGGQGSALQSGSALLTADPGVTAFLIFQWTVTGEEVLVPVESGAASNYLVAFDQTNGHATGIALANATVQSTNINVYLRDQNGVELGSTTVSLPPLGHEAFVLPTLFPQAAGQYGTVQFVPASGQQVGVVGIRSDPSGAFTSIPVLTP